MQPGSYRDQATTSGCHPMWQPVVRRSMAWTPRLPDYPPNQRVHPGEGHGHQLLHGGQVQAAGEAAVEQHVDAAEGGEQGVAEEREERAGFRDGCRTEV